MEAIEHIFYKMFDMSVLIDIERTIYWLILGAIIVGLGMAYAKIFRIDL